LERPWLFKANPTVDYRIAAANPLLEFLFSGDRKVYVGSMEIRISVSR
jgi:hypothetical protein